MLSRFFKITFSHENIFLVTEGSCKYDTFLNGQVLMRDETDIYYYFLFFKSIQTTKILFRVGRE